MKRYLALLVMAALAAGGVMMSMAEAQAPDFFEPFDGAPSAPSPVPQLADWDVVQFFNGTSNHPGFALDGHHGPNCEPPGEWPNLVTHPVSGFEQQVYQCVDHLMTAINYNGKGSVYLTPPVVANLPTSWGASVSTLGSSTRDWYEWTGQCYDDQIPMPRKRFDGEHPRNGFILYNEPLTSGAVWFVHVFEDGESRKVVGNFGGLQGITPSAMTRTPHTVTVSQTNLALTSPGITWLDAPISLPCDQIVVTLAHQTYNPTKGSGPQGGTNTGEPNTWHWGDVFIDDASPLTIIDLDVERVEGVTITPTLTLDSPAPAGAHLRFAASGGPLISVDGGAFVPATRQNSWTTGGVDRAYPVAYWHPIPEGTTSVQLSLTGRATGFAVMSLTPPTPPTPTPTLPPPCVLRAFEADGVTLLYERAEDCATIERHETD